MNTLKNKILCFGEILWDRLPDGSKPGGAPFNVALHLKNFGLDVEFAGKIGNDLAGKDLQSFAENSGLSSQYLQVDETLPTSEVLVHLDANKNATYEICEPVAWDKIELTDALKKLSNEVNVVVYGSLASRNKYTSETLISILNEGEKLKVMDVNLRKPYNVASIVDPLLKLADIAKMNEDELHEMALWHDKTFNTDQEAIVWFADYYKTNTVCVTKGAEGAILYSNKKFYDHPGFKVNTIDTVGAGDAFLAGFLSSLLSGKNSEDALNYASATGAFVATRMGATPEYEFDEIDHILELQD